jgi:TfoX/Sxy family transcriptional regulator of competence genes
MPYDPELANRMRVQLRSRTGVVEKKMFGGYCWMLHGNMLCGVEVGRFMFRVGAAQEAEALARPGARPMDITGKPMKGFVWVDAREADGASLETWIELAARYVGSLAPK